MNLDKMGENLNMNNIFCGKFGIVMAVRFVFNEISIYFTFGVSGFDISAIKVVETFFLVTVYENIMMKFHMIYPNKSANYIIILTESEMLSCT